jgi:alanyl-tRNA synthetase
VNSDEIRTAFLKFFEEKGHKVIPSSSLIPQGDPTLLLTTAGMVQVKPYFLGEAVPPSRRLASCQKCFRTTDIESVGDATHLTFFEMLGNFSVGDYFKKEAIAWAWEFLTERMKLAPEKLWITIYLDDDDSFKYWREIGIPEEKILRFGEADNFWGPAGSSGPCGPCSEIFYDFGEEVGCGKPDCRPNCDCGRFFEVWNLVFTQYDQDEAGKRTPLPSPNIDTGMGVERISMAVNNKFSVYETDLFVPLLERISWLARRNYGVNKNVDYLMRVIAEHSRGIAFLIADGVIPSNEGRGYVLRRLIRRAGLFGRILGLGRPERPAWPVLEDMAMVTIGEMGHIYPEIEQRKDYIFKVIIQEGIRFSETLDTGLELLDRIIGKAIGKKVHKISGKEAFRLYDTYGFPVELTRDIAASKGFSVDMAGFEREMEKQRERARASHKFDVKLITGIPDVPITDVKFFGYDSLKHRSTISGLVVDKPVNIVSKGQEVGIILPETPFYAEMGGQVGDTGEIRSSSGRFEVTNTVRVPPNVDVIVHQGHVIEGSLSVGDEVEAIVDMERRLDIARNHTATHLLQSALRQVLGEHIQQRGSLVAPDRLRFDFSHLAAMTQEETKEVQRIVNEKIRQNLRVYDEEASYQEAVKAGAIALFDEKYGDVVRVMKIGEPTISMELCGGTHVNFTGEIGYFHIISEGSIGAGLRRIEAVTGRGAEAFIDRRLSGLKKTADYLEAEPDDVMEKVHDLRTEMDKERKHVLSLERELARREAEAILGSVEVIKGINVLSTRISSPNMQIMREMSDLLRDRLKSAVVVLGTVSEERPVFIAAVTPDLVERGYHAGDIVKQVANVTDGSGGGKASFAQAGGKRKDRLDEALRLVKNLI